MAELRDDQRPPPMWRVLAPTDFVRFEAWARELRAHHAAGDPDAHALFGTFHPEPPRDGVTIADARLVIARAHDHATWQRLKRGVAMYNAICADDAETVTALIRRHPGLLHRRVNGDTSNWGPPLACAVQVGSPRVFAALLDYGAQDLRWALDRAAIKGRIDMARTLIDHGATPEPGIVMGPCESLNLNGLQFVAAIGAPLTDADGDPLAPVGLLLEGYFRAPQAKHACLAFFAERGVDFPDTPTAAFHLGRLDLLLAHLENDPELPHRRFSHREIYPPELGCHSDPGLALHGTPLDGSTLLHMAVDFDEIEIARWLIERGADVDTAARIDADGFGGHTPLFNTVVSQAYRSGRQRDGALARLLLDRGANPNAAASIRKGIRFHADETAHLYRSVTPLAYGRAFHAREWVSEEAMALIAARGGK